MTAVTNFVRKTPAASLQNYFKRTGIQLMPAVDWDAPEADVVPPLLQAVEGLDDSAAARVVNDAERVTAMADEAGQAAIYSVAQTPDRLDELQNDHDRALWMFLHDLAGFRHAEEVRFTDERRRGRMWDGFIGEPNLTLKRDTARSMHSRPQSATGFSPTTSTSIFLIGIVRPSKAPIARWSRPPCIAKDVLTISSSS